LTAPSGLSAPTTQSRPPGPPSVTGNIVIARHNATCSSIQRANFLRNSSTKYSDILTRTTSRGRQGSVVCGIDCVPTGRYGRRFVASGGRGNGTCVGCIDSVCPHAPMGSALIQENYYGRPRNGNGRTVKWNPRRCGQRLRNRRLLNRIGSSRFVPASTALVLITVHEWPVDLQLSYF
jgi:hypothetical protein